MENNYQNSFVFGNHREPSGAYNKDPVLCALDGEKARNRGQALAGSREKRQVDMEKLTVDWQ